MARAGNLWNFYFFVIFNVENQGSGSEATEDGSGKEIEGNTAQNTQIEDNQEVVVISNDVDQNQNESENNQDENDKDEQGNGGMRAENEDNEGEEENGGMSGEA